MTLCAIGSREHIARRMMHGSVEEMRSNLVRTAIYSVIKQIGAALVALAGLGRYQRLDPMIATA